MIGIIPEIWLQAQEETEGRQSQIQGFLYGAAANEREGQHTIRDCTKEPGDQVIWSKFAKAEAYDDVHAEMMREIDLVRLRIVKDQYYRIIRELQPDQSLEIDGVREFPCDCGGEFKNVIDSRPQYDGTVRRRRTCTKCPRRITTMEVVTTNLGVRYG